MPKTKKKILFVCSANQMRSCTAEDMFAELYPDVEFDSAGTNIKTCNKLGTNPLDESMLEWCDKAFVMENKHFNLIKSNTKNKYNKKIRVLNIKDIYKYGDRKLKEILKAKVTI